MKVVKRKTKRLKIEKTESLCEEVRFYNGKVACKVLMVGEPSIEIIRSYSKITERMVILPRTGEMIITLEELA